VRGFFISSSKNPEEKTMSNPNIEQLAAAQKANTDVLLALLRTAFNGVERLTALNISASRELFNSTVSNTQQLMAAKDANSVGKLNSELAQPSMDKWVEYSRNVYNLGTEVQQELTSVIEAQYSNFTKSATSAVEKATAGAPAGSDVFAAALKSVMSASTQAFENINSVTKQLSGIAEANIQATTKATTKAVSATAAAAKKSAAK
jgi:phasin family protein